MNAFVASYDQSTDQVRFRMEPVLNGQIEIDDGEFISLSKLASDPWASDIAVADGDPYMVDGYIAEDEPGLREDLAGILMRRFEPMREAAARNKRKFEQSGYKTYAEYMKRPMPAITLNDLRRAHWDSQEYKNVTIKFFRRHGVLPEFNEDGTVIEPVKKVVAEETYPQFPRIPGSLGDLADAVFPDIPYLFKVIAGFTHFGLIRSGLDTLADEPHLQTRLYSVLVAGPGRGKTAAINEIGRVFKAINKGFYEAWPSIDSGPALVDAFDEQNRANLIKADGTDNAADVWMSKVLLSPDELRGLIERSKVTSNSRNTLLDELLKLYEANVTGSRVRGAKIKIRIENAHLALIGGATPAGYNNMWVSTGSATDGAHTRFVTVAADLPRFSSRPKTSNLEKVNDLTQELQEQAAEPGRAYQIDDAAWAMFDKWWTSKPADNRHVDRLDGIVKRILVILARTNDVETIGVDLMTPAIAVGDYIQFCREKHNPGDAVNYVQAFENRIIELFKKRGPMTAREVAKAIHPERHNGGFNAFNQAFDVLKKGGLKEKGRNIGHAPIFDLDIIEGEE